MKYRYTYNTYDDEYYRILDETDETYYVINRDEDEFEVYKDDCDDPFWLDIIPKGSPVLYDNQFPTTIIDVDINDYVAMYSLQLDKITWVCDEDIVTINY